jgi:GntR family transcriptional regulator/MocR family aminotransferase
MNRENDRTKMNGKRSHAEIVKLDRADDAPLYRQIYQRFRSAFEQGLLRPGDRLSSARTLASELGVARGTVETAYSQLTGEGYFVARGQAGTVVSPHLPHLSQRAAPSGAAPRAVKDAGRQRVPVAETLLPFQLGVPALDAFPRKLWSRLTARRARSMAAADMFYGDPAGYAPLREAIAAYLLVSRGVVCRPAQVFVTAGYRASLAFISHALLKKDDKVWTEDPGFPPTRELLLSAGHRVVPVPVDAEGMFVAQGIRKAPAARMAIVTPSHQAPLGVSMAMARRLQLLAWASRAKAWIVEDDYDGEYRYAGAPLPALKSLDRQDRVLYAGSFSKVLFPGLALAYVVVPESLVDRCEHASRSWSNGCPQMTQAVVTDFLSGGHFARHLKKMRLLYARRRAMLAGELLRAFSDEVRIDLKSGGMHLIARFEGRGSDVELALRAQQAGLNCRPLSERFAGHVADEGLLLGFTNVTSVSHARRLVNRLRAALDA